MLYIHWKNKLYFCVLCNLSFLRALVVHRRGSLLHSLAHREKLSYRHLFEDSPHRHRYKAYRLEAHKITFSIFLHQDK